MFCHKCGAEINGGAAFCYKCGTKVVNTDTETPGVAPITLESKKGGTNISVQETPTSLLQTSGMDEDTVYAQDDFKAFVDAYIRQTTKFQSAEELLDSRVPQKFMWLCFGIPAVIGLIAGGPFGALLFGLFFGYPAVFLTDFIKGIRATGPMKKIDGKIDPDELLQFLNEHLSYLSPHFHEWGYLNYSGFGVRGAVQADLMNSFMASMIRVGTAFGRKKMCFVEIRIWKSSDETAPDSDYCFNTAIIRPWPSKYVCMVKAVPVLQAIMEYYVDHYMSN